MDDAQKLDAVRRGKVIATDPPALPEWAQAFEAERPVIINAWIARWHDIGNVGWTLTEPQVITYLRGLEDTVQAQREMLRDLGADVGVMVEERGNGDS